MLTLWRKFNYRHVPLGLDTFGEKVAVLQPDGTVRLADWQGFITADAARRIEGARPVRLVVHRIEAEGCKARFLKPGEYVQGCHLDGLAWAVVDYRVRVVPGPVRG